jgi:hypothetical protein
MKLTGDNGTVTNAVGGTFTAQWSGTENVLFRSGKKWGMSSSTTVASLGNAVVNFAATWSSGDNVKMLGIYGWAFYASGSIPTKQENGTSTTFTNEIEYYIIQDRGNTYNPATASNCSSKKGSATIDGIVYDFHVCDRIGQNALTGKSVNFKQYFSVPTSTSSHRTSGTVTVSKHFEEWIKAGMKMDGPLYEIAMKVESYTGASKNSSGNATVTKNLLTIGGSIPTPSSNSGGVASSSSRSSSSSGAPPTQATTCSNFIGTLPANPNPPSNPYTACFKHTNNKCYVCKVENESGGNTCATTWVWSNGTQNGVNIVDDNISKNYWYYEVTCPAGSSSSAAVSSSSGGTTPILNSNSLQPAASSPLYYSLKGEPLGNAKPQKAGVYIIKQGSSVKKIIVW